MKGVVTPLPFAVKPRVAARLLGVRLGELSRMRRTNKVLVLAAQKSGDWLIPRSEVERLMEKLRRR